jgi:hexosaminidase
MEAMRLFLLLLTGMALLATTAGAQLNIVPMPRQARLTGASFTLKSPVQIRVPAKSTARTIEIAEFLASTIRARTGFKVRVGTDIREAEITLDTTLEAANPEAYSLDVNASQVAIRGASPAGLLWGVQTLRQLLPVAFDEARGPRPSEWEITGVAIRDEPRFRWRGSLVDAGRHFFPVEAIKRHIDILSRYRMNVFHWHLTEDQGWRIEIRRYPRLTEVGAWRTESDGSRYGGFYTQRQIRDIVEYARLRGVTVVPEIEMPGHSSAALAAYPELGCTRERVPVRSTWGVFADIYCAGSEMTFEFLGNVLDEVMDLFPSRYIHIGGDEVPKERWKECVPCQEVMRRENLTGEEQLQTWFMRRIDSVIATGGRQLIGWDEVLEGGPLPGVTIQAWRDTSYIRAAIEKGHEVIASPSGWTYLNTPPDRLPLNRVYTFDPVPDGMDSASAQRIIGGEVPLWSEHITSARNLELMAYPRMLAFAEALWTGGPRDTVGFNARLDADQIPRLGAMGVAVGPRNSEIARIGFTFDSARSAARVSVHASLPGIVFRTTVDGKTPTAGSPVIRDSALLTKPGTHRIQAFFGSDRILEERVLQIAVNSAAGKSVAVVPPPSQQYPGTGARSLTDGILGGTDHSDGLWQGWIGTDFEATVDLGAVQPMDTVRVRFLQNVRSWILFPAGVEFSVSDDSLTWRPVGSFTNGIPPEREGVIAQQFEALTGGTAARYVRMRAINGGRLPAWHPGAGRPSWTFADELIVR